MKKFIALLLAFLLACTCLAGCGIKALTHAEYENAALDSEVTVETYVQATQSWWDGKITAYCQSEDGAYFIYNMTCAEADAAKLVPGTKIQVTGFKSEWSGEVEITDAKFKIVKGDNFIAQPVDVTELLGTDELIGHQNEKVSFTGMTVEPSDDEGAAFLYNWDGSGEDGSDLYFNLSKDGQTYSFVVESYLCGAGTEVYEAVKALSVGDKVDLEGFLYWYEGSQPHVTSLTVTEKAPALDKDVVVLFTNDVHCGVAEEGAIGYSGLAAYKKSMEADNYVILADAGDFAQGGPIGTFSKGQYLVDIMNYLGYDVATPGNHEFDYGLDNFFALTEKAEFPLVSANFIDLSDNSAVLDAYKMFDFNGIKIAFVGISTPETFVTSTPTYFQNDAGEFVYSFCQDDDGSGVYAAVQAAVDAAREEGAKYVIAIGHLGDELSSSPWTSGEVINNTTGIDAFIDGHSHSVIDEEGVKNADGESVLWAQTGTKLTAFGKLVIGMDGNLSLSLISDYTEKDADTDAFIADIQSSYEADLEKVVAHTDYDLEINMPGTDPAVRIVRCMETNLADLVADAYRTVGEADICITNAGGIRATIPAGDITYNNILTTSPFGNTVCVIEATGQQIVDALEMGARSVPDEVGGFL